jgi:acyl-CoA synthetase (AMP-forming)/AMP-acid ligase II
MSIKPGDRVAILWENSLQYIVAHFGILMAGGVEVSLNPEFKPDTVIELLNDCDVNCLIISPQRLGGLKTKLQEARALRHVVTNIQDAEVESGADGITVHSFAEMVTNPSTNAAAHLPVRAHEDLASIVYTSGSTGRPKGVMLSHRNLCTNAQSVVDYLGICSDDRMMVVLPFHYIYGRSLLYTHFLSGGSIVLDNRFAFPSVVVNAMEDLDVTCFAGVPTTYSILVRKTDFAKRPLPKLRVLTQAGGAMAPAIHKELVREFPHAKLFIMYGSTETAPRLTYLRPELALAKAGSIGSAIPGVEVIVADNDGNEVPQGELGEIAARGPNIMMGYWNDPEGTREFLRDGYYFTGDLGYVDSDGCIFLTGRSRDMIKPGGNRVSAREIEEAILESPGVAEVAVVGVPDDVLGEAIKAFVVAQDDALTAETLKVELSRILPTYKVPSIVEFTQSLPKNSSGKILKSRLAERAPSNG